MKEFGGFDSAFIRTAIHLGKDIFEETVENMQLSYEQNCLAVMYALQAVLPPLVKAEAGQVVVQTSATGEKPQPSMMSYCVMRAAANMMCRCAAMTVAPKGLCVNVVGTKRLGETEEAAHFALALLDGYNTFTTGHFFSIAGGFNEKGMEPF